jgi:hypothetical protein
MKFSPPPPSLRLDGPLSVAVARLTATIEAEARFAWEASEYTLALHEDGRLAAGEEYEPSFVEAGGFRSLLVRYNDSFPRAYTLLSTLTAPTVAAIWREAYRAEPTGRVQVCERHAAAGMPSAVYGVYPPGYPVEYTVADVAQAVLRGVGGDYPCRLLYDAAASALTLTVELPDYDLLVTATDTYGEAAPLVEVVGKDGRNYGQPRVGPTRRRRPGTGGASTSEGIVERIHAAGSLVGGVR